MKILIFKSISAKLMKCSIKMLHDIFDHNCNRYQLIFIRDGKVAYCPGHKGEQV